MKLRKDDLVVDRFGGMFQIVDLLDGDWLGVALARKWGTRKVLRLVIGDFGDSRGLRKIAI